MNTVKASEVLMREQAVHRTHMQTNEIVAKQKVLETYCVNSTGSIMDTQSSVAFIHRYCSKLPGDKYGILPLHQISVCSLLGRS